MNMLLGLDLGNYFGTRERYFFGFSLETLSGLKIGTGEGSLVGVLLRITLGTLLESTNTGADIPGMLMSAPIKLGFGYEAVRRLCC